MIRPRLDQTEIYQAGADQKGFQVEDCVSFR